MNLPRLFSYSDMLQQNKTGLPHALDGTKEISGYGSPDVTLSIPGFNGISPSGFAILGLVIRLH
jgi:hypothetical protein